MDFAQITARMDKDKADHLFGQFGVAIFVNMAMGFLVFLFFRRHDGGQFINFWLLALILTSAIRLGVLAAYRVTPQRLTYRGWLNAYTGLTALAGAVFGSLELSHFFLTSIPLNGDLLMGLIIAAMCSAAAIANSASFPAVVAFLAPALLPLISLHTLAINDPAHLPVGVAGAIFLILTLLISQRLNRFVEASLLIRYEKSALLEELAVRDQRLTKTQRIARLGYFEWDMTSDASYQSEQSLVNFGLSQSAGGFGFRRFLELVHPDDRSRLEAEIWQDVEKRKPGAVYEFRILRPDGKVIFNRSEVEIEYGPDGEPKALRGSSQDVTDIRMADSSAKIQAAIMEHIAEGVQLTRVADSVIVHTNRRFDEMFGYGPGELVGKHVSILNYPRPDKSPEETAREIDQTILEKGEWRGEIYNVKKDGTPFWCSAAVTRYQDAIFGDVMLTVQTDVTQAKTLAGRLADSEEWHKSLYNNAPDAIFLIDADSGMILDVNEAGLWLMDKHRDELIGAHHSALHPPEIREKMRSLFRIRAASGLGDPMETLIQRNDGSNIPVEISSHRLHLRGRDVVQGMVRDISSRKKAEEALRESQRALSSLIGNLQGVAYRCRNDRDWTVEFISGGVAELTGHLPAEFMKGRVTFGSLIHQDDAEMVWQRVQEALAAKEKFTIEYRIRAAWGDERWVWEQGHGVYGEAGQLLAIEGFISDVSARKTAESALQASEKRFRFMAENVKDVIYVFRITPAPHYEYVSPSVTPMTGYTPQDHYEDPNLGMKLVHPDDFHLIEKMIRGEEAESPLTLRWRTREGRTIWTEQSNSFVRGENGSLLAIYGVARDITARKQAEEALRESEELFRMMFENAPLGAAFIGPNGVVTKCNDRLAEIIGAPKEKVVGVNMLTALQNPGQKAAFAEAMAGRIGYFEGDYVSVTGHKSSIIRTIYAPITGAEGQLAGIIAMTEDITARKKMENALRESEQKFMRFFTMVPIPLGFVSNDGVISYFNQRFTEVFGYSVRDTPTIADWWKRAYPDETYRQSVLESWNSSVAKAAELKTAIEPCEYRIVCGNGEARIALIGGVILEEGILATFIDVTERKKAEEILAKSEKRFRELIQSIDAAVVVHRADTSISAINSKALELLGITEDQAMGRTAFDPDWKFIDEFGGPLPQDKYPVNQALGAGRAIKNLVVGIIRPAVNDRVWVLVSAFPVYENNHVQEVIVTFMDVSSQIENAAQLKKAKEAAEEATELKDKFVSLVAHDLKNPIGTIGGFLSHILTGAGEGLSASHRDILKRIIQTNELMVHTINELLDLTRLKTGKVKPIPAFFEPKDVAWAVFSQASMAAEQKGISLVNEVPERMRVYADKSLYFQALSNLVTNAVKFSRRGGAVKLCAGGAGGATLVVEDQGVGMSQAQLDALFRSGGKITTVGTAGERGTGLGLPYTLEIMKAHGGDLCAESEQGKGCKFYLSLPEVKPLVLVADDEPGVRALLASFLRNQNYEAEEAGDGSEILRIMEKRRPHLLLLDLAMPEKDGFAVIKEIRAGRKYGRMPIIVLTADDSTDMKEKALRLGADDYLTKPVSLENMLIRINRLILNPGRF